VGTVSTPHLRPLAIGEILDVGIKAYAKNARVLITIGAVVGVPLELLSGVIQLSTVSSSDQISGSFTASSDMPAADYSRARVAGLVLGILIGLVVTLLLTAATVQAVSDAYLGRVPSARESLRFAVRRIGALLWLYVLLGVGLTLAAFALLVPAIWLFVAWSVATPVLLIENVRGTAALRRSFRLVRRRWWPTAGVLAVAGIAVSIAGFVLEGLLVAIPALIAPGSVLVAVIASTIGSMLAVALVYPLQGAVITILYFDLRVRKEGFDLTLLAADLGLPEAEVSPEWLPAGAPAGPGGPGEAPPFWPPPPGWRPSGAAAPVPGGPPSATVPAAGPPPPGDAAPPFWPPPPGWPANGSGGAAGPRAGE
jgi:hypothetical protein